MKKKIVFGITSLGLGGAERVLVDIANRLKEDYDVTIFTLYGKGEFEKDLDSSIHLQSLYQDSYQFFNKIKKIWISLQLLILGKKIYQDHIQGKYEIEIAFLEGPVTRLFHFSNLQAKKIAWVHNDIEKVFGNGFVSTIKRNYDAKRYDGYEKLIFVSKDNLEKFNKQYPQISKDKMQVIVNYISKETILKKSEERIDFLFNDQVLNVGVIARLTHQKGIERLAKVHARLKKEGYEENIYVIGEGPEKENIEKEIREQKIKDSFFLLGKKENPYPYMKQFDVIVLVSYYEGYGMVLEEAKILNKRILITDTAAREALQNTDLGKIVENSEQGIYEGLKSLIMEKRQVKQNIEEQEYDNEYIIEEIKGVIK